MGCFNAGQNNDIFFYMCGRFTLQIPIDVFICPDKGLKIDGRMKDAYEGFLSNWNLTEEIMNAKKSRIITEAWQATS